MTPVVEREERETPGQLECSVLVFAAPVGKMETQEPGQVWGRA